LTTTRITEAMQVNPSRVTGRNFALTLRPNPKAERRL
jgi:hypothetical protein